MTLALVSWLPWRPAVGIALGLLLVALLLGRARRAPGARRIVLESALVVGMYAAWQYAASLATGSAAQAQAGADWVIATQHRLGWPDEATLQAPFLDHDALLRLADSYYAIVHVPVFVAVLAWALVARPRDWPFHRTTVALLTGACLLIQYVPVAPPRLVPSTGVVDTAEVHGTSVYDQIAGANQYSAMPSLHVAWAAAVALVLVVSLRSRWRWLALLYPLATTAVVVVTGNHYLLDAAAAVLLLAAAAGVALLVPSQRPERWSARRPGPEEGRDDLAEPDAEPAPEASTV